MVLAMVLAHAIYDFLHMVLIGNPDDYDDDDFGTA